MCAASQVLGSTFISAGWRRLHNKECVAMLGLRDRCVSGPRRPHRQENPLKRLLRVLWPRLQSIVRGEARWEKPKLERLPRFHSNQVLDEFEGPWDGPKCWHERLRGQRLFQWRLDWGTLNPSSCSSGWRCPWSTARSGIPMNLLNLQILRSSKTQ